MGVFLLVLLVILILFVLGITGVVKLLLWVAIIAFILWLIGFFMASIHYSSFEAGRGLRKPEEAYDPAIAGFLDQSRDVLVGVRASLDRALEEGWSMVLEGVHLVPGLVELPPAAEHAVVAQCILEIEEPDAHESH